MSSFFKSLPSFATDYSGFLSVMHGLGGLMIVHDPSGCLGNYTNTDEPRWYHDPQPVLSSRMRELEAVIGDTSLIIDKAKKEIHRRKPPFVCVFGTPVPALTGCDMLSIADELEAETGVRCFGIETDGFLFYDDGIEKAMELILDEIMIPDIPKVAGRVNVLGMTPLDYSIYGEKESVVEYIEKCGMHVGAFVGMGDSFEKVRNAKSAGLNIVMSAAAFPVAKRMKTEDGIDYVIGPFCNERTLNKLPGCTNNKRILIVGEQLCANSLRNAIRNTDSDISVTVATFFKYINELSEAGDRKLHDEIDLVEVINSGDFDSVIADPLVAPLCNSQQHFIPCAHPALSSKLHWQETILYSNF